jgi:signal peptidase I
MTQESPALGLVTMTTGSMRPSILPGDFMLVEPLRGAARPGDLVVLPPGPDGARAVHRVVWVL